MRVFEWIGWVIFALSTVVLVPVFGVVGAAAHVVEFTVFIVVNITDTLKEWVSKQRTPAPPCPLRRGDARHRVCEELRGALAREANAEGVTLYRAVHLNRAQYSLARRGHCRHQRRFVLRQFEDVLRRVGVRGSLARQLHKEILGQYPDSMETLGNILGLAE